MCGIAGFWEIDTAKAVAPHHSVLEKMTSVLSHRGPDASGLWMDESAGVGLGHRRLAITDLTDAAAQPMQSQDGRYVIVYNGAIYNFREIGKQLEERGVTFRSRSDTEVLLEAIAAYGLEPAVKRCNGMFAFALWDRRLHELSLVRDRIGVKPLYYARTGPKAILFASQSKSFLQHPGFRAVLSPESVAGYFHFGYLPAGRSMYDNGAQVLPGHILTVSDTGTIRQSPYWSLPTIGNATSESEAVEKLDVLLESSVKMRMVADVPVGAFISGGVDSSTVAACMQKHAAHKVKSFCVGFASPEFDESRYAREVAKHLGTDHSEIMLGDHDLLPLVEQIPDYYDEPFADFSMLPTMLVSKAARGQVTVCLSGDGGDELFGGYSRYKAASDLFRLRALPKPLLQLAPAMLWMIPLSLLQGIGNAMGMRVTPERIRTLGEIARAKSAKALLMDFYTRWGDDLPLMPELYRSFSSESFCPAAIESVSDMQRMDLHYYLPDDILTKVDRASMAFGLEAREPLLDHRLVEWAFSLPPALTSPARQSKRLLRKVLYRHVPPALIERPKQGFTPPLRDWLRGTLRDWAESLLTPSALSQDGLLDAVRIQRCWQEHLSGTADHTYRLWCVLMFLQWRQHYRL